MMGDQAVEYIDLGFTSARQFWVEVALVAYERFTTTPNGRTAIEAAAHAWHIHEWLWHEMPGPKTKRELVRYRDALVCECPKLAWVQDIAEAGKHRRLGRETVTVTHATQMPDLVVFNGELVTFHGEPVTCGTSLRIKLKTDASTHDVADALKTVVAFWEGKFASLPV